MWLVNIYSDTYMIPKAPYTQNNLNNIYKLAFIIPTKTPETSALKRKVREFE